MINTVTSYANSWGYQLNESTCKLLVFNGIKKTAKININGMILTSCNAATHVGIELNTSMKSAAAIDARVRTGRSSLFSRTGMVFSLLGWLPISAQIEQRKLNFFHKLLTMDPLSLSHQLLDYRVNLFILRGTTSQSGLIPDAYVLLNKYNLTHRSSMIITITFHYRLNIRGKTKCDNPSTNITQPNGCSACQLTQISIASV